MELSIDRRCKGCGKDFFAYKANQQYCSNTCRERAWNQVQRSSKAKEKHICKQCNGAFETHDKRKIFCSKKCRYEHFNAKRPTTKAIQKECPQCHKKFIPMQKRGIGKKYCSSSCQHRFNYAKNHTSIQARQSRWMKKNKWGGCWEDALHRDKYTCQLCGKTIYPSQWHGKYGLAVHHRDGSGETDSKNHDLENLITLCTTCHHEFHMKVSVIFKDGKYFVRGKIFDILGLKNIDTCS